MRYWASRGPPFCRQKGANLIFKLKFLGDYLTYPNHAKENGKSFYTPELNDFKIK